MLQLHLGRPGGGTLRDFRSSVILALNSIAQPPVRLRAGFAYATYNGVQQLLESLDGISAWHLASKSWLLGVHNGITDQYAISSLASLSNSQVRLATCGIPIRQAVQGERIFHAKVIAVDSGPEHEIAALISGSANLTGSAIGAHPRNFEAGISWTSPVEETVSQDFSSWWQEAWSTGIAANSRNVARYVDLRTFFRLRNPDLLQDESQDDDISVAGTDILWIEAGSMTTGGSNNAVDFSSSLASFFGPVSDQSRSIVLVADGGKRWTNRPLTPKRTTFNVRLWRLSLPTKTMGGFDYKHQILRFTKLKNGKIPQEYQLDVADPESSTAKEWQLESGRRGTIGRTGGGHNFGFR